MKLTKKIVIAWDLDETLGCFVELGMLWDTLKIFFSKLGDNDFSNYLTYIPCLFDQTS